MRNVIVVGAGRVGSQVASMLSNRGDNVSVIDVNPEAFKALGSSFNGRVIQGIGFDEKALLAAGVETCDVVAAMTNTDNVNVMIVEIARRVYGVPQTMVRLQNPNHEHAYMDLGIDYVCGTSLAAEEVYSKIVSGHANHLDSFGDYEVLRFSLDLSKVNKKTVRARDIEKDHEIRVVAFERADGSASSIPAADSVLYHGDKILVCIRHDMLKGFSRYIKNSVIKYNN